MCGMFKYKLPVLTNMRIVDMLECTDDELRCNSGQCIPREKWCNYFIDCPDTSDEQTCGKFWLQFRYCIVAFPPSQISPRKTGYIVAFPPENWLYSSLSPGEILLYSQISPFL